MKNRGILQIASLIIIASLCLQINAANQSFTQKLKSTARKVAGKTKQTAQTALTRAKQAAESGKKLFTKEQMIKRINQELSIVKAGVEAAEKKLKGQVLTTGEKTAISLLVKHASILAALVVVATGAGVGAAAYAGLKQQEVVDLPSSKSTTTKEGVGLPLTVLQSWDRPLSQKEKELLKKFNELKKPSSELPIHDVPKEKVTGKATFKEEYTAPTKTLLEEIRKGKQLKKTKEQKEKEEELSPLKKEMIKRRQAIAPKKEKKGIEVEAWE